MTKLDDLFNLENGEAGDEAEKAAKSLIPMIRIHVAVFKQYQAEGMSPGIALRMANDMLGRMFEMWRSKGADND